MALRAANALIPVPGCWLHNTERGKTGRIAAIERHDGRVKLCLQWGAEDKAWCDPDQLRSAFEPGHHVEHLPAAITARSLGIGVVQAVRTLAGCDQVLVQFAECGTSRWLPYQSLARIKPIEDLLRTANTGTKPDHAERFRLRSLAYALQTWDENTGALGRLDIDPLPHQIHVAHKVVSSGNPNWVIADDVGLGKTIEVGLILHALRQRQRCRRVLIVCPAGLVRQWQDEMRYKFDQFFEIYGIDFRVADPAMWRLHDNVIVSLDLAKREEHRQSLRQAGTFDVVIFDEAHRLGRDAQSAITDRHRLAMELRALTPAMLLLTATPHQGRSHRFATLLELCRPDLQDDLATLAANPEIVGEVVIRNRKSRVTDAQGRPIFNGHDTHRIAVLPSEVTRAFDVKLRRYLTDGYNLSARSGSRGRAIGFVMTTYRKLASSSIAAIERALRLRLERLRTAELEAPDGFGSIEAMLESGEADPDSLADQATLFAMPAFFDDELDMLEKLIEAAQTARADDEKLQRFIQDIARPQLARGDRLLVFTQYRATQTYLAAAIAAAVPDIDEVAMINGSMSLDDKRRNVARFTDGDARVMVSTEAGGEGLNLQRACHVMVNYDLPWNPSRLVQRIGRLYRYGQEKRVVVFNIQTQDGFDSAALGLMIERVETIARDMAAVAPDNRETIEAEILGELLEQIDLESILERATSMRIELAEGEIARAIETAREAQAVQDEVLAFADRFEGVGGAGSVGLDREHLRSFVEAMLPHAGIAPGRWLHKDKVLEIRLADDQIQLFPEFGRRQTVRLCFERELARTREDYVAVDFASEFFATLIDIAKNRRFEGLFASIADGRVPPWLGLYVLRWQNAQGEPLEDELLAYALNADGSSRRLPQDDFAGLLRTPLASAPRGQGLHDAPERLWRRVENDTAKAVNKDRQPGSIYLLAGARAGS